MSDEKQGLVKVYFKDKGFGFLQPDDGGAEMFLHVSALRGIETLDRGDRVFYRDGVNPKNGRPCAVDLRLEHDLDEPEVA